MRWLLAAAFLLAIGLGVFGVVTPERATACSNPFGGTLEERIDRSDLVVAGIVVEERPVTYVSGWGNQDAYSSRIRIVATFKGSPRRNITLSPLGFNEPDCSGGPRLEKGERVLLFLSDEYYKQDGFLGAAPPLERQDLGRIAALADTPPDELEAALALQAGAPVPSSDESTNDMLFAIALAVSVAQAAVLGMLAQRRRAN